MREPSSTAYASLDRELAEIEAELRDAVSRVPAEPSQRRFAILWIGLVPFVSAILVLLAFR